MSKFAKFALLTLAAFLLIGFSITAVAAKPDKNHTLTGAPLFGNGIYCAVANMTEEAIAVNWDIYLSDGSKVLDDTYTVDAHAIGAAGDSFSPSSRISGNCRYKLAKPCGMTIPNSISKPRRWLDNETRS